MLAGWQRQLGRLDTWPIVPFCCGDPSQEVNQVGNEALTWGVRLAGNPPLLRGVLPTCLPGKWWKQPQTGGTVRGGVRR